MSARGDGFQREAVGSAILEHTVGLDEVKLGKCLEGVQECEEEGHAGGARRVLGECEVRTAVDELFARIPRANEELETLEHGRGSEEVGVSGRLADGEMLNLREERERCETGHMGGQV